MEALRTGGRLGFSFLKAAVSTKRFSFRRLYSSDDKFKEFKDEDATEILDVHEERLKVAQSLAQQIDETEDEPPRERTDRLELDELVHLMKTSKSEGLTVLSLPPDLKYVEFLVIATGRSKRHILSLGETIRKHAKDRLNNIKNVPQLEGSDSEWIALDLGNICVHVMSYTMRGAYDLESLWGVGAKYDIKLHQQDEKILALLKKHSYSSYGSDTTTQEAHQANIL